MTAVLIVDDNVPLAEDLAEILADAGFRTETASSGEAAIRRMLRGGIDVLLVDLRMPGMSGVETLLRIRERGIGVPAIAMSAYTDEAIHARGTEAGVRAVIEKPIDFRKLERLLAETAI